MRSIDPFKESREDFRHYYRHCWAKVWKKEYSPDKFNIVKIYDMNSGRSAVVSEILKKEKNYVFTTDVTNLEISKYNFDFSIPDLGMCNVANTCAYVSIIPQRQYMKGFNTDHRVEFPFLSETHIANIPREIDLYHAFIWEMYHRTPFVSIQQAFKDFNKGKVSRALSPSFGLSLSRKVEEVLLFYKTTCIGFVKDRGEVVMSKQIQKFPHIIEKFNNEVKQ